jgi:hypothetical protein
MDKPKITDEELKCLREKWQHSGFPEMIALIDEVEELRASGGPRFEHMKLLADGTAEIDRLEIAYLRHQAIRLRAIINRMWPCTKEVTVTSTTSSTTSSDPFFVFK